MTNSSAADAVRRVVDPVKEFLHTEAAGGLFLLAGTVVALGWANSPFAAGYEGLWGRELTIGAGPLAVTEDLKHWVNDGLMALFFFVVGLEIKRELVVGELHDPRRASLPVLAALGGVVVPAGIFLLLNTGGEEARGWGIPMATDIAFAIGVLAVLGSRVPAGAKVFLLTLAIVDDILAITVIAVFYTGQLAVGWLAVAAGGMVLVFVLRWLGVRAVSAYVPLGVLVWLATLESGVHATIAGVALGLATLESGVHATIAGVALGLATPARPVRDRPVLEQLQHRLHPLSSYLVIPLFALANAGVPLGADALGRAARSPVAWGVALGLVAGKVLGVAGVGLVAVRLRLGALPDDVTMRHVLGLAALAGIGFTVSLFIAELAYPGNDLVDLAKVGILAGSLISGLGGAGLLATGHHLSRARTAAARIEPGGAP
jgi:Na+:H+ antiporter, NhaA family